MIYFASSRLCESFLSCRVKPAITMPRCWHHNSSHRAGISCLLPPIVILAEARTSCYLLPPIVILAEARTPDKQKRSISLRPQDTNRCRLENHWFEMIYFASSRLCESFLSWRLQPTIDNALVWALRFQPPSRNLLLTTTVPSDNTQVLLSKIKSYPSEGS